MSNLKNIVLPLTESQVLVESGIWLTTALIWVMPLKLFGEARPLPYLVETEKKREVNCHFEFIPAPALSEMTFRLKSRDCDKIAFTNETADGESSVSVSCMLSDGRNFDAHETTELRAAAALLMKVKNDLQSTVENEV